MIVPGLLLAAGAGTRFGGAKQLAELDGRPLLEHAVAAALAALPRVVVVLGARAEEVRAGTDLSGAEVVVCPDWEEGLAASLRAGLAALGDAREVVVLLGDQPGVSPEAIAWIAAQSGTCRAVYSGTPGHPVKLAGKELRRARTLKGDAGARDLLRDARGVECAPLADPRDVDTPSDLEAIRT